MKKGASFSLETGEINDLLEQTQFFSQLLPTPEFPNPKVGHRFAEAAGFAPGTTELGPSTNRLEESHGFGNLRGVLQGLTPHHQLEGSHK